MQKMSIHHRRLQKCWIAVGLTNAKILLQLEGFFRLSQHGTPPILQSNAVGLGQEINHLAVLPSYLRPGDLLQNEGCEIGPRVRIRGRSSEELPVCSLGRHVRRRLPHIRHGTLNTVQHRSNAIWPRGCGLDTSASAPAVVESRGALVCPLLLMVKP